CETSPLEDPADQVRLRLHPPAGRGVGIVGARANLWLPRTDTDFGHLLARNVAEARAHSFAGEGIAPIWRSEGASHQCARPRSSRQACRGRRFLPVARLNPATFAKEQLRLFLGHAGQRLAHHIGVFDRSSPLPTGGYLEQSDGTAWMAFFASVMLQIAVELAVEDDPHYEAMALKYFEHFLWIASAMDNLSFTGVKLWDHDDGIYYDVLRFPDGNGVRLKVRSLVGLVPLAATTVLPGDLRERLPRFFEEAQSFLERHPYTAATVTVPLEVGAGGSRIVSLVNSDKL